MLVIAVAGVAVLPAWAHHLDCTDAGDWPCCPAHSGNGTSWYCSGSSSATSTFVSLTATEITRGGARDVRCDLVFDYTWSNPPCGAERTVRICGAACEGNPATCGGGCYPQCQEIVLTSGTGHAVYWIAPDVAYPGCYYCTFSAVDVTGNTACNALATTPCTIGQDGPCWAGCGSVILTGTSTCVEVE